jgi:dCMP deaminase
VDNAMIYTTFSPCLLCAKMIINAGLKEVVYHARYSIDDKSSSILNEAGIVLRPLND